MDLSGVSNLIGTDDVEYHILYVQQENQPEDVISFTVTGDTAEITPMKEGTTKVKVRGKTADSPPTTEWVTVTVNS